METTKQRRRKRKHITRSHYIIWLLLCFCCFVFLRDGFFTNGSSLTFPPVLIISRLPLLFASSTVSTNSIILDSTDGDDVTRLLPLKVEAQVLFPDHVLVLLSYSNKRWTAQSLQRLHQGKNLYCVYHRQSSNISNSNDSNEIVGPAPERRSIVLHVLSVDEFDDSRSIGRCPTPPANYSTKVLLKRRRVTEQHSRDKDEDEDEDKEEEEEEENAAWVSSGIDKPVHSWKNLVYDVFSDGETVVVFAKASNLRPDRSSRTTQFLCSFFWENQKRPPWYVFTGEAVSAGHGVVRCKFAFPNNLSRAHGIRVTIQAASLDVLGRVEIPVRYKPLPSIAKIFNSITTAQEKYELCVCTMIRNQASYLREWIIHHAWHGVERWFIYDNNSDDDIKQVIDELNQENYNVSRHVWPWLNTQEAGFSHCILRAKTECNWVGFIDVDEFFYFPPLPQSRMTHKLGYPIRDSLKFLVTSFSSSATIGEIRTAGHSFGPLELSRPPSQGVMVGYTCRLPNHSERHKSIMRLNAVHDTLLKEHHQFRLETGYIYVNLPGNTAVINRYNYQVWEAFWAKFIRRVDNYVADWQENQNKGSEDRVPVLGTEAIEPPNWQFRLCEALDTGLRDFVMANLADPATGILPWESHLQ